MHPKLPACTRTHPTWSDFPMQSNSGPAAPPLPNSFLSQTPNFKLHTCVPLREIKLWATLSARALFLCKLGGARPCPPCSLRPAARPGPSPEPAAAVGALHAGARHLLPSPSSPRRPGWPSHSRAARRLLNLRVAKTRGRPGQLPAAAPPLPDPPPSGVAANCVPPNPTHRRSGN